MLCRILLIAAAILYIVCVLLLGGLTKEDLSEDTVQKLNQHNVDFDTINTKEMRESCLDVNITNDSSQYLSENIAKKAKQETDNNGNVNSTPGQNYRDNKIKSDSNIDLMMDRTEPDYSAYLRNVTNYALTLLHDKIGMENREGVENNKGTRDKTNCKNLETDQSVVNNQYDVPDSREGVENVTQLNKIQLSENSLWNITRQGIVFSNKTNNNINPVSSYGTAVIQSNYETTQNIIYMNNGLNKDSNIRKKQLLNDYLYKNYNDGKFKIQNSRNLIKLNQINNNLNIYPKSEATSTKYKESVEQATTSQEYGKLSEILSLLSNIQNSINQSYTPKNSINDEVMKSYITRENKHVITSTKQVEYTQIVTQPTETTLSRDQDNIPNNYTQLYKIPNLVSISKLLHQILIIPPEDTRFTLNNTNNIENPRKIITEHPNFLDYVSKNIESVSTIVNNNNDAKSNMNLAQKEFQQRDFIQLLSDSLWEKLRTKLPTTATPLTTTPSTTTEAITTVRDVYSKQLNEDTEKRNISLSANITPNLLEDIVNKVKVTILKEFKNQSNEKSTEKPTNYDNRSEDNKLMSDFLNVFKQLKNKVFPTMENNTTERSDFQINDNKYSGIQAIKSENVRKISSLRAKQSKIPFSAQRNTMPQLDMMPSIQYSIPRKSPIMIQTNLFEIPPLYQPKSMVTTNIVLQPKETYGINIKNRWQKEYKNSLRHNHNYQAIDITQIDETKDEKSHFSSEAINRQIYNNFPKVIEKSFPKPIGLTLNNNKPNLNNILLTHIKKIGPIDNNKMYDDIIQSSNTQYKYNADVSKINTQWNNNFPEVIEKFLPKHFGLTLNNNKLNLNNILPKHIKKVGPTDNNKMYDDSLNNQSKYNADVSKINSQWNSDVKSAVRNKLRQKVIQDQDKEKYKSKLRSLLLEDIPNTVPIVQNDGKIIGGDYDVYTSKESNGYIDYNKLIKNIKEIINKGSQFQAQVNSEVKSRNKDVYIDSKINRDLTSNISFKEKNVYSKDRQFIEKRTKYISKNQNTDDVIHTFTHFNDKTKIKINSQEVIHSATQTSIDNINVQDLLQKLKNEKFHVDFSDIPMENYSDNDKEMLKINSDYISGAQAARTTASNPNSYQELLTNIQKEVLQFVHNKNSKANVDIQNDIKLKLKNDNPININLSDSNPLAQNNGKDKVVINNDIIEQLNNLVSKLKDATQNVDNKDVNKQTSPSSLDKTTEAVYENSTKSYYENNTSDHHNGTFHDISNTKSEVTENLNLYKNINVYNDLVEKIKDGTIKSNNVQDIINEIIKKALDSKSKSNEDTSKNTYITNDLIIGKLKDEIMKSDNFTDIFRGIIKQVLHSAPNQETVSEIEKPNKELNISSSNINISKNINGVTAKDIVKNNIDSLSKSDALKSNPSIYDELINQNFDFGSPQKSTQSDNVNVDLFNDLIGLNKVSSSTPTTITYNEILSNLKKSLTGEVNQDVSNNQNPNLNQYSKQNTNYNSDIYKEFIKHNSVFGLNSNNNYMQELQLTPKPNTALFLSPQTLKTPDPYILQKFLNKIDSQTQSSYESTTEVLKKYIFNPYKDLKEENQLNQFKNKNNKRINRKQSNKTNSDYDEIKLRNMYKYSDTGKGKTEAREHIQNIIDTLDHEIEERSKLHVSQRYQAPIRHVQITRGRDDKRFKNFIKTQQKVNDILSNILANSSNKRLSVVTI